MGTAGVVFVTGAILGDTFTTSDGTIRLICQDAADLLAALPDKSVDCVITSPPFNMGRRDPKAYGFCQERSHGDRNAQKWNEIGYADDRPEVEYEAWLQMIVWQCLRVSRGIVAVNHRARGKDRFLSHPLFLLYPFRDRFWSEVIWDRRGARAMNCRRHGQSHEGVYLFGKPHWWNQEEATRLTVWRITPRRNAPHACPWPLLLAKRLIEAYCPPGGLVCDPFAGLATAAVAAFETGRRFVGCDNDARAVMEAKREIQRATERYALFGDEAPMTLPMPSVEKTLQRALEFCA